MNAVVLHAVNDARYEKISLPEPKEGQVRVQVSYCGVCDSDIPRVAELGPSANGKTPWDFSYVDPMVEDFMKATAGHTVVVNFSTIPQSMYKTDKPVSNLVFKSAGSCVSTCSRAWLRQL